MQIDNIKRQTELYRQKLADQIRRTDLLETLDAKSKVKILKMEAKIAGHAKNQKLDKIAARRSYLYISIPALSPAQRELNLKLEEEALIIHKTKLAKDANLLNV